MPRIQNNWHFTCKLMSNKKARVKYDNLILCGDFNVSANPCFDTTSPIQHRLPSLQTLLHQEELYNVWCCLHDRERNYTYFLARHNTYSCIDIFLVDKWVFQRVSSADIADITWSNHAPITIEVTEKDACASSRVWCCNTKLIQDPSNTCMLSKHLQDFFQCNAPSSLINFLFGMRIRHLPKVFSSN